MFHTGFDSSVVALSFTALVPKLQLGHALVLEAPASHSGVRAVRSLIAGSPVRRFAIMHPDSDLTSKASAAARRSSHPRRGAFVQRSSRVGLSQLCGSCIARAILLLLFLALPALAADSDWHALAGTYATFQAPAGMVRSADNLKANGGPEIFESPTISLSFECSNGALSRELRTDVSKAIAYWATERRKNWRVNTYLEDEQHLAYAAIRTVDDPTFHDPRPYHLSFGFASGDKPFAIHFRFLRPEDLDAIERLLQSLKLKTL